MKVGIVGQKWLGESVFKALSKELQIVFVAAPLKGDRLAEASKEAGLEPVIHGEHGLAGIFPPCKLDLLIAAHTFVHIPAELRSAADWCIGYHPSLLPLHRGRNAVEAAVAAGDKVTGGTAFHLDEGFDTGPIAFQDWCFIGRQETPADLWRRALAPIGVDLLVKAASHLLDYGFIPGEEQAVL
ncbi:formyltransferase family protein [Shinella kummerowiae]|uniref:formyltransferase family protein n=1 Tax=Shinella kummerowiae TaxID=417745 RepID=UPI0021B64F61|nr:formyltransferase family protein [Shinella kummerowiae]MCT7667170.1 formyltransferase family protein [Shinella kummerowiae]